MSEDKESKNGVQSLEVGMTVVRALVQGQRAMMLKDIAQRSGMPPAKVHRYLVSLIRSGLVTQDPVTAYYDLGPFAMRLGFAAVNRVDRIKMGMQAAANLRTEINYACALAVWSEHGPLIARWERPNLPVTVNVSTGVHLRLLNTAAGMVFAAWMPSEEVLPLLEQELQRQPKGSPFQSMEDVQRRLQAVRETGIATVSDHYRVDGVEAIAAPVFNYRNELTLVLSVVGVVGMSDFSPAGKAYEALKIAAQQLSLQLGASPEEVARV